MNEAEPVKMAAETPPPPGRAVPYAPVPMSWSISQGNSSNGPVVVVSIQTPEGDKVFFIDPEIGKQIGEAIVKFSTASDSGLILPQ